MNLTRHFPSTHPIRGNPFDALEIECDIEDATDPHTIAAVRTFWNDNQCSGQTIIVFVLPQVPPSVDALEAELTTLLSDLMPFAVNVYSPKP